MHRLFLAALFCACVMPAWADALIPCSTTITGADGFPKASTWNVEMDGFAGRRAMNVATPPGGISCGLGSTSVRARRVPCSSRPSTHTLMSRLVRVPVLRTDDSTSQSPPSSARCGVMAPISKCTVPEGGSCISPIGGCAGSGAEGGFGSCRGQPASATATAATASGRAVRMRPPPPPPKAPLLPAPSSR